LTVTNRWGTGRAEAFSDGVFAIAITLLVLDIHVPASDFDHLWRGIAHQWPSYLAFATSFLTIGAVWLAHHAIFRRLEYLDDLSMRLNLLLLMATSFLPFPTRLVAEAIHNNDAERAAAVFYGLSLLVLSLVLAAMWRGIARHHADLLRPEISQKEIDRIGRATTPSLAFYVVVIALAILVPKVAAFGYLVIALLLVGSARSDTRLRRHPAA
jgi:uncharacterized membrane protein